MVPEGRAVRHCWLHRVGWSAGGKVPENHGENPSSLQDHFGQALAALAGKRKRFHHHGSDFLLDVVAQDIAGAMQPGLHRLRLQTKDFGGFLDVHSLDHAGDEDDAKSFGKFIYRVLDDLLNFTLCHALFRVGRGRKGKLDDLGLQDSRRQRRPFHACALATQPAQSLVHGDARQPCRKTGVAAETVQMGESPHVGLLDDIFGLAFIAEDSASEPIETAIIRLHNGANGRLISMAGASDQLGIGGPVRSNFWCWCVGHGDFAIR